MDVFRTCWRQLLSKKERVKTLYQENNERYISIKFSMRGRIWKGRSQTRSNRIAANHDA
jgi:hypothetical protein